MDAFRASSCPDLSNYEKIARILAQELPNLTLNSEPPDVVDSLENLSEEMALMPEIIKDCRLATEAFDELDQVIGHMYALADRAAELPDDRNRERCLLDEEFKGYAHIVARLAEADDFDGPSLSLATRPEAQAARRILSYLSDARTGFTRQLANQRRQINSAMDEAVALLVRLVSAGDDLSHQGRDHLRDILDRLAGFGDFAALKESPAPGPWLH
jgi:hypothetical protein